MDAVLIAGPTASGKSALALEIAERFGGMVINADSMQVYRELRILTARPSPEDEARAPHRLYGHVSAFEGYSVGRWLADVAEVLDEARRTDRLPVIVGGTGLYFLALTTGLSEIPAVDPEIRERLREEASSLPPERLHARLAAVDPLTASRLPTGDIQRILRALEVHGSTGRPLSSFHSRRTEPLLRPGAWNAVFLQVDRSALRTRIDERFDGMMNAGALDEARALIDIDPSLPAARAHGVPGLMAAIRGHLSMDAAIARAKADTRSYAKRQETWFRGQGQMFRWLSPEAARQELIAALGRARRHIAL